MDDRAAKRIALAKDVLAKIESREIRPRFGAYVILDDLPGCQTCALGSMMVACCGVPELTPGRMAIGSDPATVIECLSPLFSTGELATIEAAFEGATGMPVAHVALFVEGDDLSYREYDRLDGLVAASARAFGEVSSADPGDCDESSPESRAEATRRVSEIMQNIIANDGDFRPEQL